jgi:uncharacterized protein CbrC (UPF0167 family)
MDFKYFEQADKFVGFKDKETKCDSCGETQLCFDAEGFRGQDELSSVCPDCLRNGHLSKFDTSTCNGDIEGLKRQIKWLNPNLQTI